MFRDIDERASLEQVAALLRDLDATGVHSVGLFRLGDRLVLRGPDRFYVNADHRAGSMSIAERLQEAMLEDFDEHCWPRCPHADHPLWAKEIDGREVWRCEVHEVTRAIGDLPRSADVAEEYEGVTIDAYPIFRPPPPEVQRQIDEFLARARGAGASDALIIFAPPNEEEEKP